MGMNNLIYKYDSSMLRGKKLRVERLTRKHSFPKHWHSYYEMIWYRGCAGYCVVNGETYPVTENCLFMLTPKDFHEICIPKDQGTEAYVVSFNEQIIQSSIFSEINKGPIYIPQLPEWTGMLLERLYQSFIRNEAHRTDYIYHMFHCIMIELLALGGSLSHLSPDISPMIRESISLMLEDPAAAHTLAYFSERFHVSPAYFSRLFHENAGVSFKQYQTMLRIELAKRHLEEQKLPIIEVGSECGFNTPSQFIRAFRQLTGMTPSAYRTALQKE